MKKFAIYIETSVFGFYDDENPINKNKKQATRLLLRQIKEGYFEAYISSVTIKELSEAPLPIKERLLSLVKNNKIQVVEVDSSELNSLLENYMKEKIVPEDFEDDAAHVAYATLLKVDILVSFNLEHIVNEWNIRRFNAVNLKEGYAQVEIRTPEEVIYYGNQR